MGGRFGDGPVVPDPDGAVFHAPWHARALALTLAAGALGQWNIDISRHARERLSPRDYTAFSYYEIWIAALADLLVERGVLTRDDLTEAEDSTHPLAERKLTAEAVPGVLAAGGPADRPSAVAPRFDIGQMVRTRAKARNGFVPGGHTRLPSYAAGAQGRILRFYGAHVLPDSNAHDLGERPEPLYAVAFSAAELWAAPEHPGDEVVLDLWDSYLEPL